ncbi:hypothetical protein VIGAN_10083700 [Vigna angularis var. angularis]|uniref:Uncharacterized protein n=1 Tax=Vigna angularis var. angularis TaxID=157739 RepID=A0A0S3T3E1_PHAAN|nr:hypothetical protein VIGAN_10083700 [Vigna angularis var. angularis]
MNKNLNGKMYNTNLEDNKNPSIILHPSSDLFSSSSHHELTASPLHPPTNPLQNFSSLLFCINGWMKLFCMCFLLWLPCPCEGMMAEYFPAAPTVRHCERCASSN